MDIVKVFVSGVIVVALVTAFGTHSSGLANVAKAGGGAAQGLLHTAETG